MPVTDATMVRNFDTCDPDLVFDEDTGERVEVTSTPDPWLRAWKAAPPPCEGCPDCGLFAGRPSQLADWGDFDAAELLKRTAHLIYGALADGEEDIENYFGYLLDGAQLLLEMSNRGVWWSEDEEASGTEAEFWPGDRCIYLPPGPAGPWLARVHDRMSDGRYAVTFDNATPYDPPGAEVSGSHLLLLAEASS